MTFSKFEKYASGEINKHTSKVDAEALWNDVLPHVQKGKKDRRGIIWFFFLGLIASFIALYTLTNVEKTGSEGEITSLSSTGFLDEKHNSVPLISKGNESVPASNEENNANESTAQIVKINNNQVSQNQPVEKTIVNKNVQKKYKSKTTNHNQTEKATTIENLVASNKTGLEDISKNEKSKLALELNQDNVENSDFPEIENNEAIPTDTELSAIIAATNVDIEQQENETLKPKKDENAEEVNNYGSSRNKFNLKYGLGLYGGYSSSFGSLKAKDQTDSDYLQSRLFTEEQLETIRLGFEAIVQTKVGVYFKTGVQYSRIARQFSLDSQISSVDSVYGIQKIFINNNTMDTITIYGQVPVTTTTNYNKVTYNNFHLIDIPVLLGYNYKSESNWSFGVEAGAMINVSTKAKGEILNQDTSEEPIYDIKEDKLDWFKDNVGVSFTASINIGYFLNDNFMIYLAPTTRLESVFSTDDNPIEQKHGDLGINIGARYFIGN